VCVCVCVCHTCQPLMKEMGDTKLQKVGFHGQNQDSIKLIINSS